MNVQKKKATYLLSFTLGQYSQKLLSMGEKMKYLELYVNTFQYEK